MKRTALTEGEREEAVTALRNMANLIVYARHHEGDFSATDELSHLFARCASAIEETKGNTWVLEHGNKKLGEVKFKCDFCGCVFVANEIDYNRELVYLSGLQDRKVLYSCKCPDCGCTALNRTWENEIEKNDRP